MMPANSEVEAFAMCEAEALPNEVGTVQRIGEVQLDESALQVDQLFEEDLFRREATAEFSRFSK